MEGDLIATTGTILETGNGVRNVPPLVVQAGGDAQKRFIEFFAAQIRNRNTREAYIRAVVDFFDWAEDNLSRRRTIGFFAQTAGNLHLQAINYRRHPRQKIAVVNNLFLFNLLRTCGPAGKTHRTD